MKLSTARLFIWILVLAMLVMYKFRDKFTAGGLFYPAIIVWAAAIIILLIFGKCPHCGKRIFNLETKICPHCGKNPQE